MFPKPRAVRFDFSEVPRHWLGVAPLGGKEGGEREGNVIATHIANGVNLLFPAGERFFVRSVHRYLDQIDDPVLGERVRGFAGQEGRHANAHERYFERLRAQGYDIDGFLRVYEAIAYGFIERIAPAKVRLSATVACEHFTALLAEYALEKRLLDHAHPTMRDLLLWHAAEEIEHRSVAFDVLHQVDSGFGLRAAGMGIAAACLGGFWIAATLTLALQDRDVPLEKKLAHWKTARARRKASLFGRGIRAYLRPGFHPDHNPIDRLASDYLEAAGLA